MSARALKHRNLFYAAFVCLTIAPLLSGCGQKTASTPPATPLPVVTPFNGHVTIYTVATDSNAAQADPNGLVPVAITVDANAKDPAREAINALISYPHSAIPQGTKLLDISIDDSSGLATLNFSSEFKDNFRGGDTREAQVLNSVRETLGQFQNVHNIQFLVAGKKVDSLGGTEDLNDPLPTIIDTKEAAASG